METEVIKKEEVAIISELNEVVIQSKVEVTTAQYHAIAFAPNMEKVHELSKYLTTVNKENPSAEDSKIARINRLALVKNRTAAETIKDERKSTLIVESRLIDSLFGVIKNTSALTEAEYLKIEQHAEIKEKERKESLRLQRFELVKDLTETAEHFPLGEMSEEAFETLLSGLQLAKQAKLDAEEKQRQAFAEKERIDKLHAERKNSILNHWQFLPDSRKNVNFGELTDEEWEWELKEISQRKKAHEQEQEKIRIENEKLRKDAEEKEKQLAKEREDAAKKQQLVEAQAKAEREKHDALMAATQNKAAAEKAKQDAKLKAAKEAQAAAEEKIRKQKELDDKAAAEKLAAERKAARAPDREKLIALADQINELSFPEMKSAEAKKILLEAKQQIGKVVVFITDNAQEL